MKWIPLSLLSVALLASCNSQNNQGGESGSAATPMEQAGAKVAAGGTDEGGAVLEVAEEAYDFGTVKEGEKVEHEFTFTNTGSSPLILSNVQASCGCTTPEYSKNPIAPGEQGSVKVVFNSAGQLGKQHKVITIASNAATRNTLLHLRGEVTK